MKTRRGFTIVELLIVIVVVAILAAITIVAYTGIQDRAKLSTLQSDVTNAAKAMEAAKVSDPSEAYPTVFPASVKVSSGNALSLASETDGACVNGRIIASDVRYYYSSSAGKIQEGACPGEHISNTEVGISPNLVQRTNYSSGWSLNFQTVAGRTLTPRNGTATDPIPNQRVLVLNNTATTTTSWAVVQGPVNTAAIESGKQYKLSYYTRATGTQTPAFGRFGVMNGGATSTSISQNGTVPGSTTWQKVEWTMTASGAGAAGQGIYLGTALGAYTTAGWSIEFQDFQIRAID